MSDLNLSALEADQLANTLTEALIELGINAGERGENYPLFLADLVPEIKKLKAKLAGAHGEIKIMEAAQEKMADALKDQFERMQVDLVGFTMYMSGRRELILQEKALTDPKLYGRFKCEAIVLPNKDMRYRLIDTTKGAKNE